MPNLFTAPWSPLKKRQPKRNSKKKKNENAQPRGLADARWSRKPESPPSGSGWAVAGGATWTTRLQLRALIAL